MKRNNFVVHGTHFLGQKISDYGLKNHRVDYQTLYNGIGRGVLCNSMPEFLAKHNIDYEIVNGELFDEDDNPVEIYQYYLISGYGFEELSRLTDEIVFYIEELDLYMWGITHWGTGWDYVLTDIKVVE